MCCFVFLFLILFVIVVLGLFVCKCVEVFVVEVVVLQVFVVVVKVDGVFDVIVNDNFNVVLWMQCVQEYKVIIEQIYCVVVDYLDVVLKEVYWDVLVLEECGNEVKGLKLVVVLDVDEIVLDNLFYQVCLVCDGKEYDELSWDQWVVEKKVKVILGVVDFVKVVNVKGVILLYIFNCVVYLKDVILVNLCEQGLLVVDDSVFLGLGIVVEGCEQVGSEKNCCCCLVGQKYCVLMQFGDQLGDFVEVIVNINEGCDVLLQQYYDWFGECWWMLLNLIYGGFELVQFNNDYSQLCQICYDVKCVVLDYVL